MVRSACVSCTARDFEDSFSSDSMDDDPRLDVHVNVYDMSDNNGFLKGIGMIYL